MDALTHLFLPVTAVDIHLEERLPVPVLVALGGVALLPDFDKYLGVPGLLHSLVTLGAVAVVIAALEWYVRGTVALSSLLAVLLVSHPVLDVIDGGPVPLLFPLVDTGVGLTYPVRTVFGAGILGIGFEGAVVALRTDVPRQGFNTYGFVNGFGVASALLFSVASLGKRWTIDRQGGERA